MDMTELDSYKDGEIFASGYVGDDEHGVNMTRSGKCLRWVAVKGHANDWCIYVHFANYQGRYSSDDFVARHGDKVCGEEHIKKLVPCDDASFARYRY